MKQVILLSDFDLSDLQNMINEELSKWSSDNTELQFSTCHSTPRGIEFVCMIIIKDCK